MRMSALQRLPLTDRTAAIGLLGCVDHLRNPSPYRGRELLEADCAFCDAKLIPQTSGNFELNPALAATPVADVPRAGPLKPSIVVRARSEAGSQQAAIYRVAQLHIEPAQVHLTVASGASMDGHYVV